MKIAVHSKKKVINQHRHRRSSWNFGIPAGNQNPYTQLMFVSENWHFIDFAYNSFDFKDTTK